MQRDEVKIIAQEWGILSVLRLVELVLKCSFDIGVV